MTTNFTILKSVRLTGRIANDKLEIVTTRDETDVVENLDVKSDILPVRVECYDFVDHATSVGWQFVEAGPWRRGNGSYIWTEFQRYKDGDSYDPLVVSARSQGAATQEKPKQIYIKIKPVIDGPDES